jgi:hypothetical protein
MKVCVIDGENPRLCLQPETEADHKVMNRLLDRFLITGHGRTPEGRHLHLNLPLCKLGHTAKHIEVIRDQAKRLGEKS